MDSIHQSADQPILNIVGQKVALGPRRRDLMPIYQRWINDFKVTRTLAVGWRPMSSEAETAWYDQTSVDANSVLFTIYEVSTLRPIGNTGLHAINYQHRTAEFGIMIGEKECWGKGYGTEATILMLDYGFTALNLHNIMLLVYSQNERGIRAYKRAGFQIIGRRREALRRGGRVLDIVYMDCLATEFRSPVLARLLD